MAIRFTMPLAQWISSLGVPGVGDKLYFYTTLTSTPLDTYSDDVLTVPNTNPVVADSTGTWGPIFLQSADYKVVLTTSSGTIIATADPVHGSIFSSGFPTSGWVASGGTGDVITATYSPAITALTDGMLLSFRAVGPNTVASPTFSPNGLTAHPITKLGGSALSTNDIAATNYEVMVRYNLANTSWELLNPREPGSFVSTQTFTVNGATGDVITLRGGAATRMQLTLGRNSADWTVGIAAAADNYITGTLAGDLALVSNAQTFAVSTNNGTSSSFLVSGVNIFAPLASTTASAANVFMDNAASNKIMRVTSSLLYKKDFQPFDTAYSGPIIDALTPGTYLSLAPDDDPATRHLGMLAEDVAPIAPELVVFIPTANRKGLAPGKQVMAAYLAAHETPKGMVPDSINYDRLPVILLAEIKALRARLAKAGIA